MKIATKPKKKLENSLRNIKNFILRRYKDNLAALIVFGSANTGHFREGESDIDTMIFLKKQKSLNLNNESKFLFEKLKSEHFATQYFHTLDSIKKYVNENISWSTRITILSKDGSRVLYSTPEFIKLKKWLLNTFPSRQEIKKYVKEKDEFELNGYFKKIKGFNLTKSLMAHIRRKLQILNYYLGNGLSFDYAICLNRLKDFEDREMLIQLSNLYENRKKLKKGKVGDYVNIAKKLTNKIKQTLI